MCKFILIVIFVYLFSTNANAEKMMLNNVKHKIKDTIKPSPLKSYVKHEIEDIRQEIHQTQTALTLGQLGIEPRPYKFRDIRPYKQVIKTKQLTRNTTNSKQLYTSWGPWSRCVNCVQRRTKTCIHPKCSNSKMFEERSCDRKRCSRKTRERKDFHIVHLNKERDYFLKQAPMEFWSKWQKWTPCSPQCKTSRLRLCKSPGKCHKEKQVQNALCYFKGSACEEYVLNLTTPNEGYSDNRRYEYHDEYYKPKKSKNKCGRPYKKSKMLKIIGGVESKKYKWPWHVAVINRYGDVFCGGTLIASRWVLTASHCIRSYLKVRLNEHNLQATDGRELEYKVSKMFPHPRFDHRTVDNDIALLLLPQAVKVPAACLPPKKPKPGEICSVMGWGKINNSHAYGTPILHEAKLPIIPTRTCEKSYKQFLITKNMLCAGWMSGQQDTCAGDSGGGLMCMSKKKKRFSVNGITSFGDGCGRRKKYGIYTTVYNYLDWIHYIMEHYS